MLCVDGTSVCDMMPRTYGGLFWGLKVGSAMRMRLRLERVVVGR